MPDSQAIARTLFTAAALSSALFLGSCGNSSTTYACDGSASCLTGLDSQPAEGELVKLHLGGSSGALYGTVTSVDEKSIQLETTPAGKTVAAWNRVVAWESGDSVREELILRESAKRYAAETNLEISRTAGRLPGASNE